MNVIYCVFFGFFLDLNDLKYSNFFFGVCRFMIEMILVIFLRVNWFEFLGYVMIYL